MENNSEKTIRLKDFEIEAIKKNFLKHFLRNDHIWLFGSRVDKSRRGGDIDLYIETDLTPKDAATKRQNFVIDLWYDIGEQKIDVVLHILSNPDKLTIYSVAKAEGIQLL